MTIYLFVTYHIKEAIIFTQNINEIDITTYNKVSALQWGKYLIEF